MGDVVYSRAAKLPATTGASELRVRSPQRIWLFSFALGAVVFAATSLVHWLVYGLLLREHGIRVVGPVAAGGVTTLLFHRLLHTQREARLAALGRFRIIAEMNHHIRNALQTISYQRYVSNSQAEANRVKEAVERIEWVLKEIVPNMQSRDGFN